MANDKLALYLEPEALAQYDQCVRDLEECQAYPLAPIADETGYAAAGEALARIKGLSKIADARRLAQTKGWRDCVEAVNAAWKKITAPLDALEEKIGGPRGILTTYQMAKEQRQRADAAANETKRLKAIEDAQDALNRAENARRPGTRERATAQAQEAMDLALRLEIEKPPLIKGIATDSGKSSLVRRVVFRVVNPALVPLTSTFQSPDEKKIKLWVAVHEEELLRTGLPDSMTIPGVEIYEEGGMRTTTRR